MGLPDLPHNSLNLSPDRGKFARYARAPESLDVAIAAEYYTRNRLNPRRAMILAIGRVNAAGTGGSHGFAQPSQRR